MIATQKNADALRAERLEMLDEADRIAAKIDAGETLTDGENARFNELTAADGLIAKKSAELDERERFEGRRDEVRRAKVADENRVPRFGVFQDNAVDYWADNAGPRRSGLEVPAMQLRDSNGQWHRAYAAHQPISKPRKEELPSAGEVLAFALTGDQDYLDGRPYNATIGTGSAGGYFVENEIWGEIVDLARAQMVCGRAGARTISMEQSTMTILKVTSDPTPGYVAELGAIPVSNATFGQIYLEPKKLAVLIPISREAMEDAGNLAAELQRLAVRAVAQAMDATMLTGVNVNEPGGILNVSGINSQTSVGTPTDYSDIIDAVTSILSANYAGEISDLAWLHSPTEWGTYAGLVSAGAGADGQPLQVPPAIAGLRRFTTTSLSGKMLVGDFTQALFAIRTTGGAVVELLNSGSANGIDAVANDAMWLRVVMRFDTACLRPDFFTALTGVTAG